MGPKTQFLQSCKGKANEIVAKKVKEFSRERKEGNIQNNVKQSRGKGETCETKGERTRKRSKSEIKSMVKRLSDHVQLVQEKKIRGKGFQG